MEENEEKKKARIIKASGLLQAKVGPGPLDEKAVARSQAILDANTYDFTPLGNEYLRKLENAIAAARAGSLERDAAVQAMSQPVMQLKANAATFRYTLIGNLANIMLSFLESVKQIDEEALEIVDAHHQTLSAIIAKKMQGDGGMHGKQLENELKDACKRYFEKRRG